MNKKVVFGDDGEVLSESKVSINDISNEDKQKNSKSGKHKKSTKQDFNQFAKNFNNNSEENNEKWFEKYAQYNNNITDIVELKENELAELIKLCKNNYESELPRYSKNNPHDAKWLETALHRGTAKDRANAGALLVYSNPLGNLSALETLISYTRHSNKSSPDVIKVVTELFMEGLLPSNRKLLSLAMRGADWKALRKRDDVSNDVKKEIYSYWHFENELKDHYFEFLKNLQQCLQFGQDVNKNLAIISTTKLLIYGPEKEQMILSMLINKLGDPSNKVASKALFHLTELAYHHPNMCNAITSETEKLLFRNNISEKAQHFALSFLSQIANYAHSDVCTKLVNICFSFFKILVKKGAVNNKTMQAILRCLQKSITDAKPIKKEKQINDDNDNNNEIMTKEMQDTIYRLVHLADIKISIQTLSLLLQIIASKNRTENSINRYYNALYKKLLDINLTTIGNTTAAQFLHIVHRSIYIDQNTYRGQAFIKRLLQISLYMPSQIVCGIMIVVNKLLKMKPELCKIEETMDKNNSIKNEILEKFNNDEDDEEKYHDISIDDEDVVKEKHDTESKDDIKSSVSSWVHAKNIETNIKQNKISQIEATNYDPYHRVPAYSGAQYAEKFEILLLQRHFHPTVKVFIENILNDQKIDYYGDPLKDFGLPHFLERFSFKNPKKLHDKNPENAIQMLHNKSYMPHGSRGQSVKSLTKNNCTEDELFIFNFLEKKREKLDKFQKGNDDDNDVESVNDDEFEDYLDSLCKKAKGPEENDEDEFDLDYMKELGEDIQSSAKAKGTKKKKKSNEDDEMDNDWSDDEDGVDENAEDDQMESDSDLDDESIPEEDDESSLNDDDDDESMAEGESDDFDNEQGKESMSEDDEPKVKKSKKSKMDSFSKTLNKQKDVSSLFAAADDFAELLEETGKTKGHGTLNAVFNTDKSSSKQLAWEEKRRSGRFDKYKSKGKKLGKFGKNKKTKSK